MKKNVFVYVKENGISHLLDIIYKYYIDELIRKILMVFYYKKPLKNIIILESHNDFDCNAGALYKFALKNKINNKYKLVWFLKNRCDLKLPQNVDYVYLNKPSFKKNYYLLNAKFILCDNSMQHVYRAEQISMYLSHAAITVKNCKDYYHIPKDITYYLAPSKFYAPITAEMYSFPYPNEKEVILGYPCHDIFFDNSISDINKITNKAFRKKILWMPTFRVGGGFKRNDSRLDLPLGIPIFSDLEELEKVNRFLNSMESLLIIKLHPMQDLKSIKLKSFSNIFVLSGKDIKEKRIDNYSLIKGADALVSDYSSVAFDFLHLNKPLAFTADDRDSYKLGFAYEKMEELLPGEIILDNHEFLRFLEKVITGTDEYAEKRRSVYQNIFQFHDGDSCKRIFDFLQLL